MDGAFGNQGQNTNEKHLEFSLPNGSAQALYGGASNYVVGSLEAMQLPSVKSSPGVSEGGVGGSSSVSTGGLNGEGSYGQLYEFRGGANQSGIGSSQSQDTLGGQNMSLRPGPVQELPIPPRDANMGYVGGSRSSGEIGNQSIPMGVPLGYSQPFAGVQGRLSQGSLLNSQPQQRPVAQARSFSQPRMQPQPQFQSHQSFLNSFPNSQQQLAYSHSQGHPQSRSQYAHSQHLHNSQPHAQVAPISHPQIAPTPHSQSLSGSQPQYYSQPQTGTVQLPPYQNPHNAASALHPHSQGYSSASSINSSPGSGTETAQGSRTHPGFQGHSSSGSGRKAPKGSGATHPYIGHPDSVSGKRPGNTQYRSRPYSQKAYRLGSQSAFSSSALGSGAATGDSKVPGRSHSYSQGLPGETELAQSQQQGGIGYKTSSVDLGICSFQVNVPNNISDELKNSIIGLVPKEQLNSVFFLVSSLISKSIQFRDFHARLITILRSSQLVDILENFLREHFQQNLPSYSQLSVSSGQMQDFRGKHSLISSQGSGGRQDNATISSQYSSFGASNYQGFDGSLLSSMISHAHSKKSISRHGGHYNMHNKEDVLLQMLRHVRNKSATGFIGLDISGPSSYMSRLLSSRRAKSRCSVQDEDTISPGTLETWTERLNNYGCYLLSCESSLNLSFEDSRSPNAPYLGRTVTFEMGQNSKKSLFSSQAVKTLYKLASFYIRDILKFIQEEESLANEKSGNSNANTLDEEDDLRGHRTAKETEDGLVASHSGAGGSRNFGMGKSIGAGDDHEPVVVHVQVPEIQHEEVQRVRAQCLPQHIDPKQSPEVGRTAAVKLYINPGVHVQMRRVLAFV
ncbi:hypothetical protein HWI79_3470 [Cryptosporidium felis]|nr:hypothetical protein HWI79_3470 [Cryptosporidium felis]